MILSLTCQDKVQIPSSKIYLEKKENQNVKIKS